MSDDNGGLRAHGVPGICVISRVGICWARHAGNVSEPIGPLLPFLFDTPPSSQSQSFSGAFSVSPHTKVRH
jgi:hypothetical protein